MIISPSKPSVSERMRDNVRRRIRLDQEHSEERETIDDRELPLAEVACELPASVNRSISADYGDWLSGR